MTTWAADEYEVIRARMLVNRLVALFIRAGNSSSCAETLGEAVWSTAGVTKAEVDQLNEYGRAVAAGEAGNPTPFAAAFREAWGEYFNLGL